MASDVNYGMSDIPNPLGFCLYCLTEGDWVPAALLHEGTSVCARCGFGRTKGPGEALREHARDIAEDPVLLAEKTLRAKAAAREEMEGGTY